MTALELIEPLAGIRMDIQVELDRRKMAVRDILALQEGSVIAMHRSAGETMDILIGGRIVGSGEIVIIEETVAMRITDFKEEA
ncbi:MAG TPA: FliM/FliN family flagellar motor switch protein [Bryobacteraceae bacterium]|nr:FliM/FliN family flagellar motor switch protein [Bryobacteraceae bacterium]